MNKGVSKMDGLDYDPTMNRPILGVGLVGSVTSHLIFGLNFSDGGVNAEVAWLGMIFVPFFSGTLMAFWLGHRARRTFQDGALAIFPAMLIRGLSLCYVGLFLGGLLRGQFFANPGLVLSTLWMSTIFFVFGMVPMILICILPALFGLLMGTGIMNSIHNRRGTPRNEVIASD
ncbi:hypothetical protein EON81_13380 [bacterium]|nr:MAG: hypothetical protein EON81_13380 [bacterium]